MTIFSLSQKPIFLLKMRTRSMDNDSNTGGNVRYIFISFTRTWNHFIYSIKSQIIINKSVLRIFCGKCGWVLIQLWMVETCLKCSYSGLSVTTMFEIDFLILFSSKKNFAQFFVSSIEWKLVRYTYNLFRFCFNMFISYKYFEFKTNQLLPTNFSDRSLNARASVTTYQTRMRW